MSDAQNLLKNLSPKQLALLALRLQSKIEELEREKNEPIAILGIGCRFPKGIKDPESFWQFLHSGGDAISEVPSSRWDVDAYYDPDPGVPGKMATRWGGFLEQVEQFDAAFFGIAPREAMNMDPQQRLALEVAWEALEHACQSVERLKGSKTGVFIGITSSDYSFLNSTDPSDINTYTGTGTSHSILAGRISYLLDLRGPSIALDTACSSSLVAVHQAAQSLRNRECDLAIAGGVNLILSPYSMIGASQMRMMAMDGRCKTFDRRADGFVRGEGCGMIVLKRLSQALAAGDPILAVIRGSAVNQDGHSAGLTAPNMQAQQAVIRQALTQAGIPVEQISYVEAHGTGTSLGDPIEFEALKAVLGRARTQAAPATCWIGSVKTNLGHTEAAAGIAGLIKVVLALQHEQIPPHLHFETLNPNIVMEQTPFAIPTQLQAWPQQPKQPRYAGTSSFGWSGTNAHMIIEEAPQLQVPTQSGEVVKTTTFLLPLSARSPQALLELAHRYEHMLRDTGEHNLLDICYTTATRRSQHTYRQLLIGKTKDELITASQGFQHAHDGSQTSSLRRTLLATQQQSKVAFVFPGQGSQWVGMGQQLLQGEPIFRQALADCEEAMQPYIDWSLLQQVQADETTSRFTEIDVVQPVLFALQVALARLWSSWGILPQAVVGHSMGEVAAAHVAGMLSLPDAARIICRRSQLLRRIRGQGMMALVEADLQQAQELIADERTLISIAANNGPRTTVLSGDTQAIEQLLERLKRQGIFCRAIQVDVASHSPQVDPLRQEVQAALQGLKPQVGQVPLFSTVQGRWLTGEELDANYWMSNLREPVQFWQAIQQLRKEGYTAFVEISAHPVLVAAMQEGVQQEETVSIIGSLKRQQPEKEALLQGLASLYQQGADISWEEIYQARGRCVPLPSYPWQHEYFWLEKRNLAFSMHTFHRFAEHEVHPLLGRPLDLALHKSSPALFIWEAILDPHKLIYLNEHSVQGTAVLPATVYLETMLAAAKEVFKAQSILQDARFHKMLSLSSEQPHTVQVILTLDPSGQATVQIMVRLQQEDTSTTSDWQLYASATVFSSTTQEAQPTSLEISAVQARSQDQLTEQEHYALMQQQGVEYGPSFHSVQQLWRGNGEALAILHLPEAIEQESDAYTCHPALMDAAFQVLGEALAGKMIQNETLTLQDKIFVPVSLKRLRVFQHPAGKLWAYAHLSDDVSTSAKVEGDLRLFADDGQLLLDAEGLCLQAIDRVENSQEQDALAHRLYTVDWQPMDALPPVENTHSTDRKSASWLIFADTQGVWQFIKQALEKQGEQCILAWSGSAYQQLDAQQYVLNPLHLDDFKSLLRDSRASQTSGYRGVVYLWSIVAENNAQQSDQVLEDTQKAGYSGVLHLVQAILQEGWRNVPRLWLLTNGVHLPENAHDQYSPPIQATIQAPLWGMSRVISHEHAELRCSCIDLSSVCEPEEQEALWRELWLDGKEDQIVLRATKRYARRLLYLKDHPSKDLSTNEAQAVTIANEHRELISAESTYLVTGGLRGMGLLVASWLVEQGARHLILLARHAPSPETQLAISKMEEMGAQIRVAQCDVTHYAQLAAVIDTITPEMPPLRGVIHAAGLLDDGILLKQTTERFQTVLRPKIQGTWHLHRLTQQMQLDFFVLFSSAGALLGSPGQANYVAANAFLDAFAHHRHQLGLPVLSINWGPWAEVGMAIAQTNRLERLTFRGIASLTPQQGLAALEWLLFHKEVHAAAMSFDVRQWCQYYPKAAEAPLLALMVQEQKKSGTDTTSHPMRLQLEELGPEKRFILLEEHLREQIAHVLRLDVQRIDRQTPLGTLGFDSWLALELRNRLESSLGLQLSATLVWAYPTVDSMVQYLLEQLGLSQENEIPPERLIEEPSTREPQMQIAMELETFSEQELAALLAEEIADIRKGKMQ